MSAYPPDDFGFVKLIATRLEAVAGHDGRRPERQGFNSPRLQTSPPRLAESRSFLTVGLPLQRFDYYRAFDLVRPRSSGVSLYRLSDLCPWWEEIVTLTRNSERPVAADWFRWLTAREGVILCGQSLELPVGGLSEPERQRGRRR